MEATTTISGAEAQNALLKRMKTFWGDEGRSVDVALGRDIGYEFARLGMNLPDDAGQFVEEGYNEGRHAYRKQQHASSRYERKLLRLRLSAYKRNRTVDRMVTPEFLATIEMRYCPITRMELTYGTGQNTDATVDRVFNGAGYAVGNLAMMSLVANQAKGALLPLEILEIAREVEGRDGLSAIEWMRLASLTAIAAPPGYPAAHLPMMVYPPPGIMISNRYTLIQCCLSDAAAGFVPERWSYELRGAISGKKRKKCFDAFMEALAGKLQQVLVGVTDPELQRFAICDAWVSDLVAERYERLVEALSNPDITAMIKVAQRTQQTLRRFKPEELKAWSLETGGYAE